MSSVSKVAPSQEIDWWTKFKRVLEYRWRIHKNNPMQFKWVGEEGEKVGGPLKVHHLTLSDMMEHQACFMMTRAVLIRGRRINAIQVLPEFERVNKMNGISFIQPRWVEEK